MYKHHANNIFTINQLLFVQAHLGDKTSKFNPRIKSFLFGSRHGVHLFDLKKTTPYIKRVLYLLTKATANHQVFLFVGAHPFVSVLMQFLAENTKQHSITRKWVGGTLTNWRRIGPYVKFLYRTTIEQIRKKFVLRTEQKIEQKIVQYLKMKFLLSGIERMPALPNLVVILEKENTKNTYPLLEAFILEIPVITIINTGTQGGGFRIFYPIFGNDLMFDTLFFWGNLILQAIRSGIMQKRIFFLKTTLPFIASCKKRPTTTLDKLKLNNAFYPLKNNAYQIPKYLRRSHAEKFFFNKSHLFFRAYRSYRVVVFKRILRKTAYLLSLAHNKV